MTAVLPHDLRQALGGVIGMLSARALADLDIAAQLVLDTRAAQRAGQAAVHSATKAAHLTRVLWGDASLSVQDCRELEQLLGDDATPLPVRRSLETLFRRPSLGMEAVCGSLDILFRANIAPPPVAHTQKDARAALGALLYRANGRRRRRILTADQVMQAVADAAKVGNGYVDGGSDAARYDHDARKTALAARRAASEVLVACRDVLVTAPESELWASVDLAIPAVTAGALQPGLGLAPVFFSDTPADGRANRYLSLYYDPGRVRAYWIAADALSAREARVATDRNRQHMLHVETYELDALADQIHRAIRSHRSRYRESLHAELQGQLVAVFHQHVDLRAPYVTIMRADSALSAASRYYRPNTLVIDAIEVEELEERLDRTRSASAEGIAAQLEESQQEAAALLAIASPVSLSRFLNFVSFRDGGRVALAT